MSKGFQMSYPVERNGEKATKLFNIFYGPKKGFVVKVLPVYPGEEPF